MTGSNGGHWPRARLIPVTGIGSQKEAETRAASAVLAVLSVVRGLSIELFSAMGAPRAIKATVETYTEPHFAVAEKKLRPDGVIRISYGKSTWQALVEVKTGNAPLEADQVNAYWDVARSAGFDAVVTISNEIAPAPDAHPTDGLKVKSNSKVKVHHLSWTGLLSAAVMIKVHHGVDDPEQAWLLGELIRYLEHPASGAMAFNDIRAKRLAAALTVSAPADRGARGRCGWLVNQLKGAPGDLIIEAYPKKARMPNTATLSAVRESRDLLLDTERREPIRFRIVQHADMGQNRKAGRRTPGFIDSVTGLIETFYGSVVQNVSRWSPPAPRMTQAEERPSTEDSQRPEAEAHA